VTVKPLVIGLAGGTGSGKSTVAEGLLRHAAGQVATLPQDAYYLAQPGIPFAQREARNYDEPHAFDTELLIAQIDALIQGEGVDRPVYDFTVHDRSEATVRIEPHPIVLVEGILVLHDAALRERMALKVFVDAPADERFIRRLERDVAERGRTTESVIHQYRTTVSPMHDRFVEPSKQHANLIVPEGGRNAPAMSVLTSYIDRALKRMDPDTPEIPVKQAPEVPHA